MSETPEPTDNRWRPGVDPFPVSWMTVRGKIGDHVRGNYWFAGHDEPDDDDQDPKFPWRVWIQLDGMVDHLSQRFPTEVAALEFIKNEILGAGADLTPNG